MPDPIKRSVEQPPVIPEERPETGPPSERPRDTAPRPAAETEHAAPATAPAMPITPGPPVAADPVVKKIERILEEDLAEVYFTMTPERQAAFREKGEETTARIRDLLTETKVRAKEILKLIMAWLRLIPGVNVFFLEQEAKIKTDKILAIKK